MVFRTWILPGKVGKASQTRWHLNWDLKTSERNQRSLKGVQDVWSGVGYGKTSAEERQEGKGLLCAIGGGGGRTLLLSLLSDSTGLLCSPRPLFSVLLHSDFGLFPLVFSSPFSPSSRPDMPPLFSFLVCGHQVPLILTQCVPYLHLASIPSFTLFRFLFLFFLFFLLCLKRKQKFFHGTVNFAYKQQ